MSFNNESLQKKDYLIATQIGYEFDLNPYQQGVLPNYSYLFFYNSYIKQGSKSRFCTSQEFILGNFSVGINENLNLNNGLSFSHFGVASSVAIEAIEIGVNYTFSLNPNLSQNAFEIYISFDLNPFKKNRRGNNSKFFDLQ